MAEKKKAGKVIRLQQYKSAIGYNKKQKQTIEALGFKRLGQTLEKTDTPQIRGMVNKIPHLVRIIEE
jgi:large subunit ribosomal protein L30